MDQPEILDPEICTVPAVGFEETILCARCNRPLAMYLQPLHLETEIQCPRCGRSLTAAIRRAIRRHEAQGS